MQLDENALRLALESPLRGGPETSTRFANCVPTPANPHE
jgi:hypothetical protein